MPDNLYSEKEVLFRISEGDAKSFGLLFHQYRDHLYNFIVTLTDSRPLAEDIVQDTFLKIWLLREQLTGIENFKSYLFRMARNAVLNSVKRKSTEARILQENFSAPGFQETPFEQVHYSEVKEVIQAAVAELPQKQKLIYLLRREEGKMPREIAVQLGLSVHTVNKQLATAQKKLRDAIYTAFPTDATVLLIIFGLACCF